MHVVRKSTNNISKILYQKKDGIKYGKSFVFTNLLDFTVLFSQIMN